VKRQHPIRKMQMASKRLWENQPFPRPEETVIIAKDERLLARHVKPLLDALENRTARDNDGMSPCKCAHCRLLAEWRAKP